MAAKTVTLICEVAQGLRLDIRREHQHTIEGPVLKYGRNQGVDVDVWKAWATAHKDSTFITDRLIYAEA